MFYLVLVLLVCIPTYAMQKEVIDYQQNINILQAFINDDFIVSDVQKKMICFPACLSTKSSRLNLNLNTIYKTLITALAYKTNGLPKPVKRYICTNAKKIQESCELDYEPTSDIEHYELLCSYLQWQLMVDQELVQLPSFSTETDDHKIILRRISLKDIIQSQNILELKKHVEIQPKWNHNDNKSLLIVEQQTHYMTCQAIKIINEANNQKCTIS